MTNEELQQLRNMVIKFSEWECDNLDCCECPMHQQNKRGFELCYYVTRAIAKFNKE